MISRRRLNISNLVFNIFCKTGQGGGINPSCGGSGTGGKTGHPVIDAAMSHSGGVVEKAKAIYEASKHYATLAIAGKGGSEQLAEKHIRDTLKDASQKDVKAVLEGIGFKGFKGSKDATIDQIVVRTKTRIGGNSRGAMGDLPKIAKKKALDQLAIDGFKEAT